MKTQFRLTSVLTAAFMSAVLGFGPTLAANRLDGAGGTAIYPVLSVWAKKYQEQTGIEVNYQAIGSGGGIKQIEAKTVQFGNSDKPLLHEDLAANNLVQFPQVVISIVPVVHLPGIASSQLVLDGSTLANIFLGKITQWNDPAIAQLNPNVSLPNMAILTVHRSDGSGTTFNFTDYLGKVSAEWKSNVGADTSVEWPNGLGAKGNAGVAATVQQTVGSIGYVEYAYAKQNGMVYTDLMNLAGKRVQPSMEAFQAAAANADFSKVQDFYLILTNQPGDQSWPITAATYMLMRTDYPADQNKEVLKFLDWAMRNGQADAIALDYVPLPESVIQQIEASWTANLKAWP